MNLKARVTASTYPDDELPHKCMYCRHVEQVEHWNHDAAKCKALAKHLKDQGVPLLLDEVIVAWSKGDYCETWEAMTEAQAHVHHHDETITAYAQCWG